MAQMTDVTIASISREELERKMNRQDSFVLMEILPPEEFQKAHLPGAVNVPAESLEALARNLVPTEQTEVITYCAGSSCHASGKAAQDLVKLGYTNVGHFLGGKKEWMAAGLPVERG
jgi:rhodanese-related sulfurtransferase